MGSSNDSPGLFVSGRSALLQSPLQLEVRARFLSGLLIRLTFLKAAAVPQLSPERWLAAQKDAQCRRAVEKLADYELTNPSLLPLSLG